MTDDTIQLVTGPTNATQDASGRRRYTWAGVLYPSVTSIAKVLGISHGLHRWFVNNLVSHVVRNAPDIALRVSTGDERELKVLRANLRAATSGDERARLVGISVHRAASLGQGPDEVPPEVAPKLRQYLDWRAVSGVEIVGSEFQVWNLTEGYAGTADLIGRFADGSLWLLDLKTGSGIYADHYLQLMAYAMAEFVGSDDVVDERMTEILHRVSGIGIVHLGDTGWEFIAWKFMPEAWTAFRGLIRYAGFLSAHESIDGLVAARRWSDGRRTQVGDRVAFEGWAWARIGANVAHFCPPEGDAALCFRAVERSRRTPLEARPEDVCRRCADRFDQAVAA